MILATACAFPTCTAPPVGHNRAYQLVCSTHRLVVVGTCDDLGDHGAHCDEAVQ